MELGRMRRLAACTLVAGALVPAGAGAALACNGGHHNQNGVRSAGFTVKHHGCGSNVLAVTSSYLGVPAATIKADLKSGESLGQIANATPGKSSAGLVGAFTAAIQTKLDKKVADGKLGATQESTILTNIQPWLQKLVAATWTSHGHWSFAHKH